MGTNPAPAATPPESHDSSITTPLFRSWSQIPAHAPGRGRPGPSGAAPAEYFGSRRIERMENPLISAFRLPRAAATANAGLHTAFLADGSDNSPVNQPPSSQASSAPFRGEGVFPDSDSGQRARHGPGRSSRRAGTPPQCTALSVIHHPTPLRSVGACAAFFYHAHEKIAQISPASQWKHPPPCRLPPEETSSPLPGSAS